jgi:putative YphP/YqiW family bacilliredoxin
MAAKLPAAAPRHLKKRSSRIVAYPEYFVAPMRAELTDLGVEELRTPEAVDDALARKGTTLVVVNSVCGCAAGKARPGIALALSHDVKPDHLTTVFAGADVEATERARSYFTGYPPSSPSVALLQDGQLVYMMERRQIEGTSADAIARQLMAAFDQYCAPAADRA